MEDLVPFLIFIVIALINLAKFLLEKGARGKAPPAVPKSAPLPRKPGSLETFFESLAEKLEPQPTELPDWPEGYERPDYMKEMEAFEASVQTDEEEPLPEVIPLPVQHPAPTLPKNIAGVKSQRSALKSALKAMPSLVTGANSMRMKTAPILRSGSVGRIDFPLSNKADLRKAIIANVIFSPPRAYETPFDNGIVK